MALLAFASKAVHFEFKQLPRGKNEDFLGGGAVAILRQAHRSLGDCTQDFGQVGLPALRKMLRDEKDRSEVRRNRLEKRRERRQSPGRATNGNDWRGICGVGSDAERGKGHQRLVAAAAGGVMLCSASQEEEIEISSASVSTPTFCLMRARWVSTVLTLRWS